MGLIRGPFSLCVFEGYSQTRKVPVEVEGGSFFLPRIDFSFVPNLSSKPIVYYGLVRVAETLRVFSRSSEGSETPRTHRTSLLDPRLKDTRFSLTLGSRHTKSLHLIYRPVYRFAPDRNDGDYPRVRGRDTRL